MKRKLLFSAFLALIMPLNLRTQDPQLTPDRVEIQFDRHWSVYILTKYGCPVMPDGKVAAPVNPEDCKKENAQIRYDEFAKAKALAMRIWGLREIE